MKQGKRQDTGEVIDAEYLKYIYEEGLPMFECIGENCDVEILPSSYKPENVIRPYFRLRPGYKHNKYCSYAQSEGLLGKAKDRPLTEAELRGVQYPTKLQKPEKTANTDSLVKPNTSKVNGEINKNLKRGRSDDYSKTKNTNRIVASLSPIVDYYIRCPFNRDEELEIDEEIMEYKYWFKRIEKPIEKGKYRGKKVYFGKLHLNKNNIVETDNTLHITLYECERWDRNNKPATQINPFVVSVDKSSISTNKLTRIKNEIEYAIDEKGKALKDNNSEKNTHPFIFFIGTAPTKKEPYRFKVTDGFLVGRYAKIYPTKSKI